MPLPQQVPDLPNKLEQRKAWEAAQIQAGRDGAKELVSWANYTPLVVVVPIVNWIIDNWPDWAMRSADGRGESDFHNWFTQKAEFARSDPSQFMLVDGEVWYFTRRNERPFDIGLNLTDAGKAGDMWSGWLFRAQPKAFQDALPWRVKLWEDTELPANVPLRLPAFWVAAAIKKYGLPLVPAPTMVNSQAWGLKPGASMLDSAIPGSPGLAIDAPPAETQKKDRTRYPTQNPSARPISGPGRAPGEAGKRVSGAAIVIGLGLGVAILTARGR